MERKDRTALGAAVDLHVVAIFNDEPTITHRMATQAVADIQLETAHLDRAYLLLPPHIKPQGTISDRCVGVQIPLRKAR